jgi:hypothetical protein
MLRIVLRQTFPGWIALIALGLSGCGKAEDGILEEITEQTYPLDPNAAVSIRNLDGSIRIYGSDKPEMIVQTIKKAYSAQRLKGIVAHVSVQTASAKIDTIYPPQPKRWSVADRSGTVDYNLVIPQTCRIASLELTNGEVMVEGMRGPGISAKLGTGRLVSHNCFGDLRLSVVMGNLDLFFDWWERTKCSIGADVVNGNILAMIPSDASFTVAAESVNGKVASTFGSNSDTLAEHDHHWQLTVGSEASSDIRVRTTNGNIRIQESF